MKPLLKWPGSKRRISELLADRMRPYITEKGRYIELFAGSAAVFFHLEPKRAVLVDICRPLMAFYESIKRDPNAFYDEFERICELPFCEETFNQIKREWNGRDYGHKFAARLMYLNRTGFNGLFRLNKDGEFNVAWGKLPELPRFPTREDVSAASDLLKRASLYAKGYNNILRAAHAGDVAYADPPYWDTFDRYAGGHFSNLEHRRLASMLFKATQRGVSVFASNIDCPEVRAIYETWSIIDTVPVHHKIGASKESRKVVSEIIASSVAPYADPRQMTLFGT